MAIFCTFQENIVAWVQQCVLFKSLISILNCSKMALLKKSQFRILSHENFAYRLEYFR